MIHLRTISERPFGWDFGPNTFFRPQHRKLVKVRPPLSGKHRGGMTPQPQPDDQGEPQPDEFQPDPEGEPIEVDFDDEEPDFDVPDEDENDEDFDIEIDDWEDQDDEPDEPEYELPALPTPPRGRIPFSEVIDNTIVRQFPSWYDFVTCAADFSLQRWTEGSSRGIEEGPDPWTGTRSFDEAVDMALTRGWPEGRGLFYDALSAVPQQKSIFESEIYEVAGPIPIIQIYNTGDPACMMDWQHDRRANNPIVKIDASIARHVGIKVQTIANRGAALVSLINRLELEGYSVEVNMCDYRTGYDHHFYCRVAFKAAGEQLDLDRTCMALAHASTFRRFCFALVEQHDILRPDFQYGMGGPRQTPFAPLTDSQTIFIPSPEDNETLKESRAAVEKAALSFFNAKDQNND